MSTKLKAIGTLNKGNYVVIDEIACKITDLQVSRPGKHGHAKVRCVAVGLLDGKKRETVKPGHDSIEVPIVDKRNAQVLSINGNMANVMDAETFETFDLEIPEELKEAVTENTTVLVWEVLGDRVMKQVKS
jgi:translation initiation factor 5A